MQSPQDSDQMLLGDMSIALSGGYRGRPEEVLHHPNVGAV